MTRSSSTALIVQGYIPKYRVEFFNQLRERGAERSIRAVVAAGSANRSDRSREDETTSAADYQLATRRLGYGSKGLLIHSLNEVLIRESPQFIIIEQALKNWEMWRFLVPRHGKALRVGLWGQGGNYSRPANHLEQGLKSWLTNKADWFFAYTEGGAGQVARSGFPRKRITALQNSSDTVGLRADTEGIAEWEVEAFRDRHGLVAGQVGLFLGGVDERKGMPFLLEAAQAVACRVRDFKLVVGGSGDQVPLVQDQVSMGAPVCYLGRVDGREKALALAAADIVMVPEWVGLVAVDALCAGRPIATTKHPSHSPEFEYLEDGVTAVVSEHEVTTYAASIASLIEDPQRLARMKRDCGLRGSKFSVESMADNFVQGILEWRDATRR